MERQSGFPSIGLVSTIVANYLIDALNLRQVGALDSAEFPTLSVVHTGEPLSPVRIYAGKLESEEKLAVFVSEFKPGILHSVFLRHISSFYMSGILLYFSFDFSPDLNNT